MRCFIISSALQQLMSLVGLAHLGPYFMKKKSQEDKVEGEFKEFEEDITYDVQLVYFFHDD
jgi:hypothetical protein